MKRGPRKIVLNLPDTSPDNVTDKRRAALALFPSCFVLVADAALSPFPRLVSIDIDGFLLLRGESSHSGTEKEKLAARIFEVVEV
jgi:hypothetical protein